MNKSLKITLGILLIAGIFLGLHAYRYQACLQKIAYIPQREQGQIIGNSGLRRILGNPDNGDYYSFHSQKFKTMSDAIKTCIWE